MWSIPGTGSGQCMVFGLSALNSLYMVEGRIFLKGDPSWTMVVKLDD